MAWIGLDHDYLSTYLLRDCFVRFYIEGADAPGPYQVSRERVLAYEIFSNHFKLDFDHITPAQGPEVHIRGQHVEGWQTMLYWIATGPSTHKRYFSLIEAKTLLHCNDILQLVRVEHGLELHGFLPKRHVEWSTLSETEPSCTTRIWSRSPLRWHAEVSWPGVRPRGVSTEPTMLTTMIGEVSMTVTASTFPLVHVCD